MQHDAGGEAMRLAILHDFDILDTPSEQAFDDVVFLAARICDTPIALVSLLDRDRQWFKARVGLDATETPIEHSVCKQDIHSPDLLVIPDLAADPRTRDNPLVTTGARIRFYAGAPLLTAQGIAVGRLCVIDTLPRPEGLTGEQSRLLLALARQVMVQLEQKRTVRLAADLARLQACLIAVGEQIRKSHDVADMTLGVAEVVGKTLGVTRAGFGLVDVATEIVTIEPDWTNGAASIAGTYRFRDFGRIRDEVAAGEPLIINDVGTDPRTAADPGPMRALDIGAVINMPVRDRGATVAVFIVQSREPRTWTAPEIAFLRSVADRLEAGVTRYRADRQQETLNREISHRLKNMLAMVQAIASQTLKRVVDRGPIDVFEARLIALGTAHDVLMQSSWSSAGLSDIVGAVLGPFGYGDRVTCEGPAVMLAARSSLSCSLLVHELVTNAVKYGALSVADGRVSLSWEIDDHGDEAMLRMRWRERGGPPVKQPTTKGFGSRLIQLGLVGTGGVALRYESPGLEADLTASIRELALS